MKLQVIIGSTRPGRVSDKVAKWVALEAKNLEDTQVEIVDLADYVLPYLDEPISPQYNPERTPNEIASKLLTKFDEADAYVLVTPEYNRSYSAVLKNALDYVDHQFKDKPVALVSHGTTGGAQAVSHLRGVISGMNSITVPKAVFIVGQAGTLINDEGELNEDVKANPYGPQAALLATLESTKWYSDALSAAK